MKFVNSKSIDVSGTFFQGHVFTTYGALIEIFGDPTYVDYDHDAKVNIEWRLKFEDGTVATIYNYKDYDGGAEAASSCEYEWHIGGFDRGAEYAVLKLIDPISEKGGRQ